MSENLDLVRSIHADWERAALAQPTYWDRARALADRGLKAQAMSQENVGLHKRSEKRT